MSQWKINRNTDFVDIQQKCVGLSPRRNSIPVDVADHIHRDRGLHIQIKHNGDAQTFAHAYDLATLISAAPEMLQALEQMLERLEGCVDKWESFEDHEIEMDIYKRVIAKAKGEID